MNTYRLKNIIINSTQYFEITEAKGIYTLKTKKGFVVFKTNQAGIININIKDRIMEVPIQDLQTIKLKNMAVLFTPVNVNKDFINDEDIIWR